MLSLLSFGIVAREEIENSINNVIGGYFESPKARRMLRRTRIYFAIA